MDQETNYLQKELRELIKHDDAIFDFLQNSSLDGMWYWDLENPEHEWMNNKFWQVLGYDPNEKQHLSAEWQEIIDKEDLRTALNNFHAHCQDPKHPYDQIVRYRHKNGSIVWIRCRGMAIRDQNGVPIRMIGAHTDITKLKELENKFRRNLKELDKTYALTKLAFEESEKLFELAPDAILKVDVEGNIVRGNIEASKLLGYNQEEIVQINVNDLLPDAIKARHRIDLESYFKTGGVRKMGSERGKLQAVKKDGQLILVEITLNLIDTTYGKRALATIRDVSEHEALIESLQTQIAENKKLLELSTLDSLTQVYNRRYFDETIAKEFENALRYEQNLSLMVIDIDWFKQINDKFGHSAGNMVLIELAKLVNGLIRYGDTFARIGGEEFAIILPHTDAESALALADRMVFKVEQHQFEIAEAQYVPITISIGVSSYTNSSVENTEMLFQYADEALYESKHHGRNRARLKKLG